MIRKSHFQTILVSLLLVSCAGLPAGAQSGEPVFAVTTKNADDQVHVQYENGISLIDVDSQTGIGSAKFVLESGAMPEDIVLRLHLKGLEEFRLTSSEESLGASISSGDSSGINQRIISSGNELPLQPGHPLWMNIEIVAERAEKKIPLAEGYFEIALPKEFLQNTGKSFEIQWIDFYR